MRRTALLAIAVASLTAARTSAAQPAEADPAKVDVTAATPTPAATPATGTASDALLPTPVPDESPPPLPHRKGFVLEGTMGALGFMGQFRHVAPTALWIRTTFGYEFLNWLMAYGVGELVYTDTSIAQDESKQRGFPIFGFGGGARVTIHPTDRFAIFGQAEILAMKADITKGGLGILGFKDAESLNPSFGGRLGVEWYQIDRHMALSLSAGLRDATGFAKLALKSDTALMWDGGASIRYTF